MLMQADLCMENVEAGGSMYAVIKHAPALF